MQPVVAAWIGGCKKWVGGVACAARDVGDPRGIGCGLVGDGGVAHAAGGVADDGGVGWRQVDLVAPRVDLADLVKLLYEGPHELLIVGNLARAGALAHGGGEDNAADQQQANQQQIPAQQPRAHVRFARKFQQSV